MLQESFLVFDRCLMYPRGIVYSTPANLRETGAGKAKPKPERPISSPIRAPTRRHGSSTQTEKEHAIPVLKGPPSPSGPGQ